MQVLPLRTLLVVLVVLRRLRRRLVDRLLLRRRLLGLLLRSLLWFRIYHLLPLRGPSVHSLLVLTCALPSALLRLLALASWTLSLSLRLLSRCMITASGSGPGLPG